MPRTIPSSLFSALSALLLSIPSVRAADLPPYGIDEPVEPLVGNIVLSGNHDPGELARKTFVQLANGPEGEIVVLFEGTVEERLAPWKQFAGAVKGFEISASDGALTPEVVTALEQADGVWLGDDFSQGGHEALQQALQSVLEKGGALGGGGKAAESFGKAFQVEAGKQSGFGLLPQSIVRTGTPDGEEAPEETSPAVIWEIPAGGILVFHGGREVGVIGETAVTARIPAQNGWPERLEVLRPPEVKLPYTADLFSWTRSAQARSGPVFPPAQPPSPEVSAGTLILIGGGGSTEDMWTRFIKEAGGTDANYVCIIQRESTFPEMNLRELGCDNVTVLLSDIELRERAEGDAQFLKALESADGIFFGGGRTYRFMDTYQNTKAHRLMLDTLERGGVIAGTSAGAQIQGDFLVRGDPRTNQNIWSQGNDVGLSFLRGVIIDVHFRNRGRQNTLPALLRKHPKMLGIGIDEATALVVQGTTAEVLGRGAVSFYNLTEDEDGEGPRPSVLEAGRSYNLKDRTAITPAE